MRPGYLHEIRYLDRIAFSVTTVNSFTQEVFVKKFEGTVARRSPRTDPTTGAPGIIFIIHNSARVFFFAADTLIQINKHLTNVGVA